MASATSGEGASQGGGGKFWKRPFYRQRATPYDRPPTALRNPNKEGWLTKLVDPASKLISASGRIFFSSVFPKRLPPPSPEENQETRDRLQHSVPNIPLGVQVPALDGGSNPANSSDGSGISELEQILKLKTFTSYEVDRLTELLRSKTVDLPNEDVDKRMELKVQQAASVLERHGGLINSQVQGTRVETNLDRCHGGISTHVVSSQVPEEEVATPAEIAKEYMGGLSNMSPSMLGLRHQARGEGGNMPNSVLVTPKSPVPPLVPKASVHGGAPENGFRTPRLRGRSAIYNMARMPYSRINPTSAQKGSSPAYDGYGGAFALSSQYARESDGLVGSKQLALKRRSCVLENDVGSVGPVRRIRQKTNLLTAKSFSLLSSGSPLPSCVMGVVSDPDTDTTQSPASWTQKQPSLDGPNYRTSKTVGENRDNDIPSTSYTLVPSKSTDMATRIFHQLEKLVPMEKSSAGQVATVREKLPSKLTTNMLSGLALRSLEDVDSSKIIHDAFDNQKYNDLLDTSLLDARDTTSEEEDKVEENGPKTSSPSQKRLAPVPKSDTTVSVQDIVPIVKKTAEVITSFSSQHPQKKWAFHMSAHEDFLDLDEDLDDEIHLSEAGSTPFPEQREKLEKSMLASKARSSKAVTVDKTLISSEMKTLEGPVMKQSDDFGASDPSVSGEKKTSFTFPTISSSHISSHEALVTQSTSAFDKNVPRKDQIAPTPLFSCSSDNIDKVSALAFSSLSSASEFVGLKGSAPTESKPESSYSLLANVASVTADTSPDIVESDKGDNKKTQLPGDIVGKPENSNSVLSTSISSSSTFSFGASDNNSSLRNGSIAPVSLFSSPTHIQVSSTFANHTANNFTDSVSSTTGVMSDNGIATTALIGSVSTTAADPPSPAATVFKFGSTIAPSNSVLTISTSSAETTDLKAKTEKETISANLSSSTFGGTSSEMPSTGNNIFGFSASANSSSTKGSLLDISSGSSADTQSSTVGTGISTFTKGMPMQFGLSVSSLVSGTSGDIAEQVVCHCSLKF